MVDIEVALGRIAEKLQKARERKLQPAGWEKHHFVLEPPVSEAEINRFEQEYQVTLPEGYRTFVTCLGNGPAGPSYGLFSFQEALETTGFGKLPPKSLLSAPFSHKDYYQPLNDQEYLVIESRREVAPEEDERYWTNMRQGALVLSDEGCGMEHFLILTGSARGEMWVDNRANDGGMASLKCDFLTWYERWLDGVLAGSDGLWWWEEE
jgi:SMI1 / KNR4 family (SUKH-1)